MPLNKIKGFLIDMDGTTYLSDKLLPGVLDFINHLDKQNIKYIFFTNNPFRSVKDYALKLNELGLKQVTPENIITSGQATINYLKDNNIKKIYLLGTPSYEKEVQEAGIALVDKNPEAIVLSYDTTLTYNKLEKATHFINAGIEYIATNPDDVCPTEKGPIPDCGAIAALLESATEKTPLYIGKPFKGMLEAACSRLNLDKNKMAIIGDRLNTDIKMANDNNLTSILVLSGETDKKLLANSKYKPDFVFNDLKVLLQKI